MLDLGKEEVYYFYRDGGNVRPFGTLATAEEQKVVCEGGPEELTHWEEC